MTIDPMIGMKGVTPYEFLKLQIDNEAELFYNPIRNAEQTY